jgi:L-arabinokinase
MTTVLCYISAHGFGHSARTVEVLNALSARCPDLRVAVRTTSPRWLFELNMRAPFTYAPVRLDVGAIQHDSLSIDIAATLRAQHDLAAHADTLIAREVAAAAPLRPDLVLADIPALAFDVARSLDVPGVGMANFSWDWIYADYVRDTPAHQTLVDAIRASYGAATLLLRLPLHGDLSAFPRIRDIPFVARTATVAAGDARQRLDLSARERLVLLSFGGFGVDLHTQPDAPAGFSFVTVRTPGSGPAPSWCRELSTTNLTQAGLHYEDVVGAVDVVVTKPGYGIVAECIANRTAIIYTPRGRFAEYPCLTAGIEAHLRHAVISNEDLHAGRWRLPVEKALAHAEPPDGAAAGGPAVDGAAVAAEILSDLIP